MFSGVTRAPFRDVRDELAAGDPAPVRWRETMTALAALGADAFLDVGPDQVLARLVARNLPDAEVLEPRRSSSDGRQRCPVSMAA